MTTEPSGVARPGKIAGLALIGVAAVATVVGVITLVGGNGEGEAQQPPSTVVTVPSSVSPQTEASTEAPPSSASDSVVPTTEPTTGPTTVETTVTTTAAPTMTTAAAPEPPSIRAHGVRIYNNSTEKGLAVRARQDLESLGWQVVGTGNYSQGIIPVTTVYFRQGTDEEAAANELAHEFGIRAEVRFEGIKDSSPGIILIVTNNYRGPSASDK
jgi:hypothetical protein